VSASYWPHGAPNVLSSNLAGLPSITYGATGSPGLDGEGRITSVTASSGQSPLVSAVNYTTSGTTQPIGSLTQVTFGSSDYDTFSYDPNTGRMSQYKSYVGATPQTVTSNLTWNANGSLGSLAITDQLNSANSQTCNYSHDDLGRIATANCGTTWNQTFGFDPFGNISKSATAGISFLPTYSPSTNRYSSVPGCMPSYDANGFATNDCAHSYSWDSEGNPLTIDAVGLTYDALGRMVEQARGTTYSQIVYGPDSRKLALMNGSSLSKAFVTLPGGGAAVYTASGLTYYRHADWLGSGRLATTPVTRAAYFDVAYGPYGEGYAQSGSVDLDFTGQSQDTVSGLYDFLFREFNANQGRWPRPDPAGMGAASTENPQTWNRYAYVGNMPLISTDSLGLMSDVVGTGKWGEVGRDPGAAWLSSVLQSFEQQLMQLGLGTNQVQQGLYNFLTDIDGPGTSVGEFNLADQMLPTGTDCAALVNGTAVMASKADSVEGFMDKMASTFTAAKSSGILEMLRTQNMRPATTYGDSGFKPEFQDGSNQVRHFVGGLVAGYRIGRFALPRMNAREDPGNPDTKLNAVSTELGMQIAHPTRGPHFIRFLAAQIRKLVCR
jgi:RHS repeat-associated protein